MKNYLLGYADYFHALYCPNNVYDDGVVIGENESAIRDVTFVVTDKCQLRCTYCYEVDKDCHMMTKETAKAGVDRLFEMYYADNYHFINKKTRALVIDFMGGEPFLNIDVMEYITSYFLERAIKEHHIWARTVRFAISTNGQAYFDPKVQKYLEKYKNFISMGISIDGPKHIHDACRIYPDGRGSFDIAYKAFLDCRDRFHYLPTTKITLSPDNLDNLMQCVKFFVDLGVNIINMNCVYEAVWSYDDAKKLYKLLKELADYLLIQDGVSCSMFNDFFFHPLDANDVQCWCGGGGKMLSFDWDGIAYPCTRFCPTSLGKDIPPIQIGTVNNVFTGDVGKETHTRLEAITRRTKSNDECFYCPIAAGCSDCEAWNYQAAGGKFDVRCTNICPMHKATSLANVYYQNKLRQLQGSDVKFKMWLPKEEALKIIDEDEYEKLLNLSKEE